MQLTILWLSFADCALAADWRNEQWRVAPFAAALGGGPETGPLAQTGGTFGPLCFSPSGNIFLAAGQRIDIVTPDGLRWRLAGTDEPGFRDGPAPGAQFQLGISAYYGLHNIACGPRNDVYVPDSGNGRIRRIYQEGSQWRVMTWAGGGDKKLNPGEKAKATEVSLGGTLAVASGPDGRVFVATGYSYYRISADGALIEHLGDWPESTLHRSAGKARLNVVGGDHDLRGNIYFGSSNPDVIIRITPDGKAQHIAGRVLEKSKTDYLKIGDGPPLEAFFDTISSMAVEPDGSAVYVTGGDEYDIRRIPTDGKSSTATLMQNGRWGHASVHPNRSRGPALFDPSLEGTLKPAGGLTNLVTSYIHGRDREGNLYCSMNNWSGMTQFVAGEGLLGTRIFKVYRANR